MNADLIFDPVSASNDDLLDRYESVRLKSCRERDILRLHIAHRMHRLPNNVGIVRNLIRYWLDQGELMRTPIGRFRHLAPKYDCKVYRTVERERELSCHT